MAFHVEPESTRVKKLTNIFMDKNQSELDEFMGSLGSRGNTDPLDHKQDEDPFNHLEDKGEKFEEEAKPEKALPFNKDPKIQKFIEKEISKRIAEIEPQYVEREAPQTEDKADDILTRLIGNDTPEKLSMIKEFKGLLNDMSERGKAEALQELYNQRQAETQADIEAEEELSDAFDSIEENFGVDITSNAPMAKKIRSEFVSFVERIAPKDRNGDIVDYPDMNSAWETFSDMKKATSQPSRAKELASRSMSRSAETSAEPVLKRGRTPFSNSDDFIESLSK